MRKSKKQKALDMIVHGFKSWSENIGKRIRTYTTGDYHSHVYFVGKDGKFMYADLFLDDRQSKMIKQLINEGRLVYDKKIMTHQGVDVFGYKPADDLLR